jgi:hypothetical protein
MGTPGFIWHVNYDIKGKKAVLFCIAFALLFKSSMSVPAADVARSGDDAIRHGNNINRNHGISNRQGDGNQTKRNVNRSAPFSGRTEALSGHIFDLSYNRQSKYLTTIDEIKTYVQANCTKYTPELMTGFNSLQLAMPQQPANPVLIKDDLENPIRIKLWEIERKEFSDKNRVYTDFLANLYSIVYGQCTKDLQERVMSHADFQAAQNNGFLLLHIIKSNVFSYDDDRNSADAVCDIMEKFFTMKQTRGQTLQSYYERLKAQVEVLDKG